MYEIKASIAREHYKTILAAGENFLTADEPETTGGRGKGFSPGELLAASLGACISITLRMYADRKEWPLEKVEVDVSVDRDEHSNITNIRKSLVLVGDLDDKQRTRLRAVADKCPIHKILSNTIHIEYADAPAV
jgi:putative redox protein